MKKNFLNITLLLLLIVAAAACTKDQDFLSRAKEGGVNAVGFGPGNNEAIEIDLDASTTQLDTLIKTFLSASQTYGSDIKATVSLDSTIIDNYNDANGTELVSVPAAVYTIPSVATIPANTKQGGVKLSVDVAKLLTYGTEFALGFRLTKVEGGPGLVQSAHSALLIIIKVKNQYDADYAVSGFVFHPSAPRAFSTTKHISTVGATTCEADAGDLGASGYHFRFAVATDNSLTKWTATGAMPTAPASGFMTDDNPGKTDYSVAAPNKPGSAPYVSATYNNTYDPSAKIFWMHYGYASGGNGQLTYTRQIYEKWVKK